MSIEPETMMLKAQHMPRTLAARRAREMAHAKRCRRRAIWREALAIAQCAAVPALVLLVIIACGVEW